MDVITIGIWKKADEKREIALKFMKRVKNAEFNVNMLSSHYLVTLNRKHLKKNQNIINEILEKYKLRKIKVVFPNEI